jgi:hypothetical protein
MNAAEADTGGTAVSVARVAMNGAFAGYHVRVHMPGQDKGWRVEVEMDTDPPKIREKKPIPNPEP